MSATSQQSENLTARESLDLIAAMIREAKGNVRRNNFFFLLWGWVVAIANVGMYVLERTGYEHPYAVWLITIPAWIYTIYKVLTRGSTERTTTHFDRISASLWMTYSITIFTLVFFGYKVNFQLNPLILMVSAIPTIVSGVILKFRPLIFGGMTFWISAIISFLVTLEFQPLVGALGIICGYLVPGYMLRIRRSEHV